jgi:hypothetical protein
VDGEVAAPGVRGEVGGGLNEAAHGPDQRHDVGGGDAWCHGPGGDGARGELLDRRSQPRPGGWVGGAGEEQVGVARVAGELFPGGAQVLPQPLPGGRGQGLVGGPQQGLHRQPQQLVDERVLAGEPPVHGAHAHPGANGDLLHGRRRAKLTEDLAGGLEHALVVPLDVPAGAPRLLRVGGLLRCR